MTRRIFLVILFLFIQVDLVGRLGPVAAEEDWSYILLRGNLHVHTIYSNGTTSGEKLLDADHSLADLPGETVEHAQKIGLQVLGLSDHNNVITQAQWQGILAAAERSYSNFFCLSGIEWTQGGLFTLNPTKGFLKVRKGEIAHINVFGAKNIPDKDLCPDFYAFYRWLRWQPDKRNIVCQFNHPGFGDSQFDKFNFQSDLSENFCLLEIGSGPTGFYEEVEDNLRWYNLALHNGWRVAPSIGIDNWGTIKKSDARRRHTGIWLELLDGLSQEGVLAALRARRVFASEDSDARLKYWAESEGKKIFMGGEFTAAQGDEIKFFLDLRGREKFTCQLVEIKKTSAPSFKDFGASKIRLLPANFTGVNVQHAHADTICYYLEIKQIDGDHIISAPIWLKLKEPVGPDPGGTQPSLPPPAKPTPPRPQIPPKVFPPKPVLTMAGLPTPIPSNWNVEILAKGGRGKSGPPSFFGEGSEVFVLEDGSQWRGETGFRGNKYLEMTQWLYHIRVAGFLPPYDIAHAIKIVRYTLTKRGWAVDNFHSALTTWDWDVKPVQFWSFYDVRTGKPNSNPITYLSEQNNWMHTTAISPGWYAFAVYIDNLPIKVVRFNLVK